ncbi:MAG: hypothetical protein HKP61_11760 [Dactylosporangium sp.]|nr:hypothetical protein [Dactylosporangium sp.]NNJ61599.1 hypothetical protein [Dactylosporangium sp.]
MAAGIGALVTVPLVAVPARVAQQANNSAPQFTAGGYAAVGVVIGLIVAFGVINVRAVAANVVATAAWLWVLAAVAVTHGLQLGTHTGTAQLATWQFSDARWLRGMVNLPGALLMLGMATLIGVAAAWRAGRQGDHRVGVAISGAVGPLLVAVAYFLAVPGIDGKNQQLSAYVTAPYAVIAGLAGSVLVSALGSKGSRERARLAKEDREAEEHAEWQRAMTAEDTPSGGTEDTAKSGSGRWSALKPRRGRAKTAKTTDPDDDDAYAPARAYGADTASTGKSGSTTSTGGSKSGRTKSTASSSPSTATPVWPEEAKPQSRRRKSAR